MDRADEVSLASARMTGRGPEGGILTRAIRNSILVLGGKGTAGLLHLASFALAARAIGVDGFGTLSIAIAYVMLVAGFASFDSNQAVIRYGVGHLQTRDGPRFQALLKTGTLLDLGAGCVAMVVCIAAAPVVGGYLGWSGELVRAAQWAAPLALGNAVSTSRGMLRLFDRYDLLSLQALVTPAIRLVSFAVLAWRGLGLHWYVTAWVVATWLGGAISLYYAWREARRSGLLVGWGWRPGALRDANPGVWRFTLLSNLNQTVGIIPTHAATLIVAALLGPGAAGVFRLAREVGTALLKPTDLVNQTLLADINRLVQARDRDRLRRTVWRAGLSAGAAGALVTVVIWLFGEPLVALIFGAAFTPAVPVLIAIAAATSLRVLSFAADPVMFALGRPDVPLAIATIGAVAFVGTLTLLLPATGLFGVAWAYFVAALLTGGGSALACRTLVRRAFAD